MKIRLWIAGIVLLSLSSCAPSPATQVFTPDTRYLVTAAPNFLTETAVSPATPQIPVTSGQIATLQPTSTFLPADCASTAVSRLEISRCAESDANRADQKLDQLLADIEATVSGEQRDEFKLIQTQWKALAKQQCAWETGNFQNGADAQLAFSLCTKQLTMDRIQELKLLLCPERGLSGPCPEAQKY